MKYLILNRSFDHEDGTPGRMGPWYTFEEENQGNARNISRIPAGAYVCERTEYHRGGYQTFEVTGVPDRTRILFHKGNTEEDLNGCIALGLKMGMLDVLDEDTKARTRKLAVLSSGAAFDEFMLSMRDVERFVLVVIDPE